MKEERHSWELRLDPVSEPRKAPEPVSEPEFDEGAAYREIEELKSKFAKETHLNGDTALASRYQHEIVVLRQQIIENMKKKQN